MGFFNPFNSGLSTNKKLLMYVVVVLSTDVCMYVFKNKLSQLDKVT